MNEPCCANAAADTTSCCMNDGNALSDGDELSVDNVDNDDGVGVPGDCIVICELDRRKFQFSYIFIFDTIGIGELRPSDL